MFCALAGHYGVPPLPLPYLIPWRNDFSFLKGNSCSKRSSRCSRVSLNEICRSEQEAFIVFFDVPSCQPFIGWKSHFTVLTECPVGVWWVDLTVTPPTEFIWGQLQAGIFLCHNETLWPFIYVHWDINLKTSSQVCTIISTIHFCVCVHLNTKAEFGKLAVCDEGLLPGELGETESRMRRVGKVAMSGCGELLQEKQ